MQACEKGWCLYIWRSGRGWPPKDRPVGTKVQLFTSNPDAPLSSQTPSTITKDPTMAHLMGGGAANCQKRGVAYPRLPYLRRGETMLFDVRVQLVIRPEVTTNG